MIKEIQLKEITIQNFKGIHEFTTRFGTITNLSADNAVGKTSLFDAFCWCLFGKDSIGNAKFNIRPISKDGKDIDFIDISVTITILINGVESTIKKVQKQKWTKKRGEQEKVFSGNINEYEVDGIPKSERDFNTYISELITDTIFMTVTNPSYFANQSWKDQRKALTDLVPNVTDNDVISNDKDFDILQPLLVKFSISDLQNKYKKALKELNEQLKTIPSRIDEVSRTIVEIDYSEKETELTELQKKLSDVETKLEDSSKTSNDLEKLLNLKNKQQIKLFDIKSNYENAELKNRNELKQEEYSLQHKFNDLLQESTQINKESEKEQLLLTENEKLIVDTREEYVLQHDIEINNEMLSCPYCHRELEADQKEEVIRKFEKNKSVKLNEIKSLGLNLKSEIDDSKKKIKSMQVKLNEIAKEKTDMIAQKNIVAEKLSNLATSGYENDIEYKKILNLIDGLESQIKSFSNTTDVSVMLKKEKSDIQSKIYEVQKILNERDVIANAKNRVEELKSDQKEISQKVAGCENYIYIIERFIREKMDLLSHSINKQFKLVSWKLFDLQVNGGMKETCELTLNGVPYSSLNSAAKIQAGLDIINTLSDFYKVKAPIFIDNREGINEIPETDSQIINLIVSHDKELKVEVMK